MEIQNSIDAKGLTKPIFHIVQLREGHVFIEYPKGRNVKRDWELPLCFVYPHTYNSYQYRVILGLSRFLLTGTVSTSPNLAKEGARSATVITHPSGSRFS